MVYTVTTVRTLRVVAGILALALLLWSTGAWSILTVEAADVTNASDTISDSDLNAAANHTIQFTTPNGLDAGQTILLTFPAGFTLPNGLDHGDLDIATATDEQLGNTATANVWGVATSSNSITLEAPSGFGVASATTITIEIGTSSTFQVTGDTQITNPGVAQSYGIDIGGTMQDSGQVRVAILDDVLVTAQVDTSLTFTVNGTNTGATISGSPTTTAATTTATTLPFETLASGVSKTLAQELSVATNATNGFIVTVEQSQDLQSSTGADINGFIDGAYTDTPTTWTSPSGQIADDTTYGHWGLTSEDDLNADEFNGVGRNWVAASTTPRQIFQHNGPADGTTPNQGFTVVGYQAEITDLQEAGTDYNTTLTYIATPTF